MSAALVIFAILTLAHFALIATVTAVALLTKDSDRRATAVAILPVLRSLPAVRRGQEAPLETQ